MGRKNKKKGLKHQVNRNTRKLAKVSAALETKSLDTELQPTDISTTVGYQRINMPIQGTGSSNRIGAEIRTRHFTIRGLLSNNNGTPDDCVCRIIIYWVHWPRGIDYGSDTYSPMQDPDDVKSLYTYNAMEQYDIISDETYVMDTSLHTFIPWKGRFRLGRKVELMGGAQTFADDRNGALYVQYYSNVAAGANAPHLEFDARITFVDS